MSCNITFLSHNKNVDLTGVLTCQTTSSERLRHIHISLRQDTTSAEYDVKNHILCHILNVARVSAFQYIDLEGILLVILLCMDWPPFNSCFRLESHDSHLKIQMKSKFLMLHLN